MATVVIPMFRFTRTNSKIDCVDPFSTSLSPLRSESTANLITSWSISQSTSIRIGSGRCVKDIRHPTTSSQGTMCIPSQSSMPYLSKSKEASSAVALIPYGDGWIDGSPLSDRTAAKICGCRCLKLKKSTMKFLPTNRRSKKPTLTLTTPTLATTTATPPSRLAQASASTLEARRRLAKRLRSSVSNRSPGSLASLSEGPRMCSPKINPCCLLVCVIDFR